MRTCACCRRLAALAAITRTVCFYATNLAVPLSSHVLGAVSVQWFVRCSSGDLGTSYRLTCYRRRGTRPHGAKRVEDFEKYEDQIEEIGTFGTVRQRYAFYFRHAAAWVCAHCERAFVLYACSAERVLERVLVRHAAE